MGNRRSAAWPSLFDDSIPRNCVKAVSPSVARLRAAARAAAESLEERLLMSVITSVSGHVQIETLAERDPGGAYWQVNIHGNGTVYHEYTDGCGAYSFTGDLGDPSHGATATVDLTTLGTGYNLTVPAEGHYDLDLGTSNTRDFVVESTADQSGANGPPRDTDTGGDSGDDPGGDSCGPCNGSQTASAGGTSGGSASGGSASGGSAFASAAPSTSGRPAGRPQTNVLKPGVSKAPVRYADGIVKEQETDLPSLGSLPWGHSRGWTNAPGYVRSSVNGNGWQVRQFPALSLNYDASAVAVVSDSTTAQWFDASGTWPVTLTACLTHRNLWMKAA